jgi:hypothetical protein
MTNYIITTKDDLTDESVSEILKIVANGIRNEEMTEMMDGTLQLNTIYGLVWLQKEVI